MIYLTFNDPPSGVFKSQVVDVVHHLRKLEPGLKLVSLVSPRHYATYREKIHSWDEESRIYPMVPGIQRWRRNSSILSMLMRGIRKEVVICRNIYAWHLAKRAGAKKCILDARGAIAAEFEEFDVVPYEAMIEEMPNLEADAVKNADFRIAVSSELVNYWRERYQYQGKEGTDHVVIPCTLGNEHQVDSLAKRAESREVMGFSEEDVVVVFSGSLAGWQSLDELSSMLRKCLKDQPRVKLLFLTKSHEMIKDLHHSFPDRVSRKWLKPSEVPIMLAAGDYGLLLRTDAQTNRVASPVKYAEYLAAGLKVLISPRIVDYAGFTRSNEVGFALDDGELPTLESVSIEEKKRIRQVCMENLSKSSEKVQSAYNTMLNVARRE